MQLLEKKKKRIENKGWIKKQKKEIEAGGME